MRVAVDYRVLSTEAADRGMGRYTQQQLAATVRDDPETEFLVVCYSQARRDLFPKELTTAPNVRFTDPRLPILKQRTIFEIDHAEALIFSAELQEWLTSERVDVYHAATPFIPPVVSDFDACSLVATLYDLIPLVYPGQYLQSGRDEYLRGLELVQRAQRLIAISASARQDAFVYLGYPREQVEVAYPVVDPIFYELGALDADAAFQRANVELGLPEQFLLSVTGVHHSKNAGALLAAYRRLVDGGARPLPLVLVLPTENAYQEFLANYPIPANVHVIRCVSDAALRALYNRATAVVHPSRYEGFGYPVVEAMRCGAPVITTATSSLREVGGEAALLVDPDDVEALAEAIKTLSADETLREELRRRGHQHSSAFDEQQLASATRRTYELAAEANAGPPREGRRRIAVWSSLPPQKCGVGDYTAELLGALTELAEVEVFVGDGFTPSPAMTSRFMVHHHAAAARRERQEPFDAVIYQMGGTYMQEFMYEAIHRQPGIVVLHDLLMGLGFYYIYRGQNDLENFVRDVVAPEGDAAVRGFREIVRRKSDTLTDELDELFNANYMLAWLLDHSLGAIVHMPQAKQELEQRYPNARVRVVDMGVVDPWSGARPYDERKFRWRLRVRPDDFVVSIIGTVVPVKRIEQCLRAIAAMRANEQDCVLVIAGDQSDAAYADRLRALISELELESRVRLLGHVTRTVFDHLLVSSDVIVNLRYPSRKGMSAVLIRSLAAGKPVLITDIPEWEHLPDDCCFRVRPGEKEVATIQRHLTALAADSELRRRAAESARAFYQRRATLEHMAAQYLEVVDELSAGTSDRADARVGAQTS